MYKKVRLANNLNKHNVKKKMEELSKTHNLHIVSQIGASLNDKYL